MFASGCSIRIDVCRMDEPGPKKPVNTLFILGRLSLQFAQFLCAVQLPGSYCSAHQLICSSISLNSLSCGNKIETQHQDHATFLALLSIIGSLALFSD